MRLVRCGLVAVLAVGLAGCGGSGGSPQQAAPAVSVSTSTEPPYVPSPIKTVTLDPGPEPTAAETTPAECRYATVGEVGRIVGEPVTRPFVAVGGCWYRLSGASAPNTSVKITVFRNRVAQLDKDQVAVIGLGGKVYWDEGTGGIEVQLGKDVLYVEVGSIKAADKLDRAKELVSLVRKRI
ncbi:hypothetical protein ACQEVZ_06120 [Dactylosporangium sp. CA-152071]|uniref:hypothetical protein n=1 Tax=Dactylosporangium sp. CA-152071 TaxID=3239933 RepID=UPI003D9035A3